MAAYTTLVNLPHFLSSFTSLETGTLVLFLAAVFTVQLVLLQNYSRRRRRLEWSEGTVGRCFAVHTHPSN